MATEHKFEYFELQYAPNPLSEEAVNIGIILLDPEAPATGFCKARFVPHWLAKVLWVDPEADIQMLEILAQDVERRLSGPESRLEMLNQMENSFSNLVRVSERRECHTQNPVLELDNLAAHSL